MNAFLQINTEVCGKWKWVAAISFFCFIVLGDYGVTAVHLRQARLSGLSLLSRSIIEHIILVLCFDKGRDRLFGRKKKIILKKKVVNFFNVFLCEYQLVETKVIAVTSKLKPETREARSRHIEKNTHAHTQCACS